jgi:hypothetical protein
LECSPVELRTRVRASSRRQRHVSANLRLSHARALRNGSRHRSRVIVRGNSNHSDPVCARGSNTRRQRRGPPTDARPVSITLPNPLVQKAPGRGPALSRIKNLFSNTTRKSCRYGGDPSEGIGRPAPAKKPEWSLRPCDLAGWSRPSLRAVIFATVRITLMPTLRRCASRRRSALASFGPGLVSDRAPQ